ncbi:MAG: methyltransferase domain-containing protein [Planctomycetes bacterium]|nr:methyltransferase domain-containing protein [Planctomycetota bacterium]
MKETGYVLGQSERAARRLELQDRHFAAPSEALLDALAVSPADRAVELGCGPGGLTKRIAKRIGATGRVTAVDASDGLLNEARKVLAGAGNVSFVRADVAQPGAWIDGATVVLGRAILHHVPMAEFLLGRLKATLAPGTRIGFLEPDFRRPLIELSRAHAKRPELTPLLTFAKAINDLYSAWRISGAVGASLTPAMQDAGFADVRHQWHPFATDADVLENMGLIYEEVRDTFAALGIISSHDIDAEQMKLAALTPGDLPPVWGLHQVTASV